VFVVIEEYADPGAAIEHNQNCQELLERIPDLADDLADVHGDIGGELKRAFLTPPGYCGPPTRG
jgi:hypothetical protein